MSTRVTISEEYREVLKYLTDPVELCIDDGRVVAVFGGEPSPENRPDWMPPAPTREEFARMKAGRFYTTEEILEHLRNQS